MAANKLKPHSFILLSKSNQSSTVDCGALLECEDQATGTYRIHDLRPSLFNSPLISTKTCICSANDVAPLSEDECLLLNSIDSHADRYTVYTTPGKLDWGTKLKVGDTVLAQLPRQQRYPISNDDVHQYTSAVIRHIGKIRKYFGGSYFGGFYFGVEITDPAHRGLGNTNGHSGDYVSGGLKCFTCEENCGMFLSINKITLAQPQPLRIGNGMTTPEEDGRQLREQISQLEQQLRDQSQQSREQKEEKEQLRWNLQRSEQEVQTKREETRQLQQQLRQQTQKSRNQQEQLQQQLTQQREQLQIQGEEMIRLVREQTQVVTRLDEIRGQRDRLTQQLDLVREELTQSQARLRQEEDQRQQQLARIETAFAYMRGDPVATQVGFDAIELWEIPREEVHISGTILGTGGWGYVAVGTFQDQRVAVKCLHRGILSQQNVGRVRREISIMAQVRHPNLLLLIGAVLNVDTGPIIVTELLDRCLRSAYEDNILEERSKLPILRDVASALTYLHSHRRPIIHRDVSSANVLLETSRNDAQWKAKLSDFGSANLIRLATTPAEGAPPYAAPEVGTEDRNQQTPKIDVYSFGVLLCEVLLCRFPPDRREFPAMLTDLRQSCAAVARTANVFPLARDCTNRIPQDRPTMSRVLKRIDELIG